MSHTNSALCQCLSNVLVIVHIGKNPCQIAFQHHSVNTLLNKTIVIDYLGEGKDMLMGKAILITYVLISRLQITNIILAEKIFHHFR